MQRSGFHVYLADLNIYLIFKFQYDWTINKLQVIQVNLVPKLCVRVRKL